MSLRKVKIMCGRYQFTADQCAEILQIVQEVERRCGTNAWNPGEIRPTAMAPVLVASYAGVQPELYTWGYKLPKTLVINARAESAMEKPLFRDSVRSRRCVIPSTGFFEWNREKRKYFFKLPGEDTLYMAGLYMLQNGQPHYCILTTEANDSMREVHHRMPLILRKDQIVPWLEQPEVTSEFLKMAPPQLERSTADAQLRLW